MVRTARAYAMVIGSQGAADCRVHTSRRTNRLGVGGGGGGGGGGGAYAAAGISSSRMTVRGPTSSIAWAGATDSSSILKRRTAAAVSLPYLPSAPNRGSAPGSHVSKAVCTLVTESPREWRVRDM